MNIIEDGAARLSNANDYTIFKFGEYVIKFQAPYSLERYIKVLKWKNGLITVLTKYSNSEEDEEEYIDIAYILKMLRFNVDNFLNLIKEVKVDYEY